MADFQSEKDLVVACHAALDAALPGEATGALARYVSDDWLWRGFHPFDEQTGAEAVGTRFWAPLKTALKHLQRRPDIFMAGLNEIDGFKSTWVVEMGHLMGLFDESWLGIRPTRKMAFLRFCEFNKVEAGRITETAMFFDVPHLMIQAGQNPFPPQTAAHLVQPGPMPHTGLMYGPQDPAEGERTLAAINRMIGDLAGWRNVRQAPLVEELRQSWTEDMIWWGPAGIGATYTIERYAEQHSGPFRTAFTDRKFNGHLCRLAEGDYGGFFGWPNLTLTHAGGFMGQPGSDTPADMRVIDIYRRAGDKLAENWVFIDLLHWMKMQGVDVLGRMRGLGA
ncbi:MAG: ester cyclase [Paracoccaceae bacterium]|nr:ester cyclase [Paracoccaceae bacterium]